MTHLLHQIKGEAGHEERGPRTGSPCVRVRTTELLSTVRRKGTSESRLRGNPWRGLTGRTSHPALRWTSWVMASHRSAPACSLGYRFHWRTQRPSTSFKCLHPPTPSALLYKKEAKRVACPRVLSLELAQEQSWRLQASDHS